MTEYRRSQVNVRLSSWEVELIKGAADREGVTLSEFFRTAAKERAQRIKAQQKERGDAA